MSKLSIDTTKSLRIAHADLMVAASSVSADSVERFFLAPLYILYPIALYNISLIYLPLYN